MKLTMKGRAPTLAFVVALGLTMPASAVAAEPAPRSPGTSCSVFPADNVWNMDVSKLARASQKEQDLEAGDARAIHEPPSGLRSPQVRHSVRRRRADAIPEGRDRLPLRDESDPVPYPFGADIEVEGGSDPHALMVERGDVTLYELFAAEWNAGDPTPAAGRSSTWWVRTRTIFAGRPGPADAAGLPIFPAWPDGRGPGGAIHTRRFTTAPPATTCGPPGTRRATTTAAPRWARDSV